MMLPQVQSVLIRGGGFPFGSSLINDVLVYATSSMNYSKFPVPIISLENTFKSCPIS